MSAIQLENRTPPPGGLTGLRGRIAQRRRRRQGALALAVGVIALALLRPETVTPPDAELPLARLLAPADRTVSVDHAEVVPIEATTPGVRLVWVVTDPEVATGS